MRNFVLLILFLLIGTATFLRLRSTSSDPQTDAQNRGVGQGENILGQPWSMRGNHQLEKRHQAIPQNNLRNLSAVRVTYDLNGLCVLPAYGGAVMVFEQPQQTGRMLSFADYGENCRDGEQTIEVPVEELEPTTITQDAPGVSSTVWYPTTYEVEISSIQLLSSTQTSKSSQSPRKGGPGGPKKSPSPTPRVSPSPTLSPSPSPNQSPGATWELRSVSSMKETKDKICNPDSRGFIEQWVDKAQVLGVTHISIEQPYDSPGCGDALAYTAEWVSVIRSRGLNVWHRHMPLAFEGIYNTPKLATADYIGQISAYIRDNPTLFSQGDIFTPIPEPQNGGIQGVNYCSLNTCVFSDAAHFNRWLREATLAAQSAFESIGFADQVNLGYWGFDGYIAWGDNNPDWNGILEDETISLMGNITIDHYPEIVGDTMENDLNELQARYPNVPIVIGEWGTVIGGDVVSQVHQSMTAASRPGVNGFNYWHQGMGGNEALLLSNFTEAVQYPTVQGYFR